MSLDLADLKGDSLERRFREHGPAYFSRLVRRSRVLTAAEVMDVLEPIVAHGELSAVEADEVALADLIIRGRRREDNTEVYLVVEVSWGVGLYDVERAARRAELLRRTGVLTMPVVSRRMISWPMATQQLIDTDVLIDYLRGYPDAVSYVEAQQERLLISVVTVAELYAGIREGSERSRLEVGPAPNVDAPPRLKRLDPRWTP